MADPVIYLRRTGDAFTVTVEPPVTGDDWDRQFTDYREARPWARGCRLARRWQLIDECEGGIDAR